MDNKSPIDARKSCKEMNPFNALALAFVALDGILILVFTGLNLFHVVRFDLSGDYKGQWTMAIVSAVGIIVCLLLYKGSRPFLSLEMFCPHCDKYISTDTVWECGHCHFINKKTKLHPFILKCEQCSREPKAYICHHCFELIPLEENSDMRNPAQISPRVDKPRVQIDKRAQKAMEHLVKKEQLEQEIEIASLNKRLTQLKLSPEFKQEVSEQEKIRKDYSAQEAQAMGVQMLERSERAKIHDEFQDDPEFQEMKNIALDAFVEQHGLTPKRYIPEK